MSMFLRRCGDHSLAVHKCFEDASKRFGVEEGESSSDLSNNPIFYSDFSYHVLLEFQFVVDCDPKVPFVRERPKFMGYPGWVYRQGGGNFFSAKKKGAPSFLQQK